MTASSPSQSVPHLLDCSQHPCMFTCAANALGTLIAHLAAISPHSIPSHGSCLFDCESSPSSSPANAFPRAQAPPTPAPPASPPTPTHPISNTLGPAWDQWLSTVIPPDRRNDLVPNPLAKVSANKPSTRTIGTQSTDAPREKADAAVAQLMSTSLVPASTVDSPTTAEFVNVIALQERTILDLESKCESLTEQHKLAQQQHNEQIEQLRAQLNQAVQDRVAAADSAHDASVAADEALNAISDMYQQVVAVAGSVRRKRSKSAPKSATVPHPESFALHAQVGRPPDPRPTPHAHVRPSQAAHASMPSSPSNFFASTTTNSSSTLSSPWSLLESISPPVPNSIVPSAFDPTRAPPPHDLRSSLANTGSSSHRHPSEPPALAQPSPPVSAFARTYWPASVTLGLGLAHSKHGAASHSPHNPVPPYVGFTHQIGSNACYLTAEPSRAHILAYACRICSSSTVSALDEYVPKLCRGPGGSPPFDLLLGRFWAVTLDHAPDMRAMRRRYQQMRNGHIACFGQVWEQLHDYSIGQIAANSFSPRTVLGDDVAPAHHS